MKKMCMFAVIAAMIFSSCSKENDGPDVGSNTDVAYVSIRIETEPDGRAGSTEDAGLTRESDIKSIYLITFNSGGTVEGIPDETNVFYKRIITDSKTPDAQKVSSASKNLVVIANPGPKLQAAITGLNGQSTLSDFNAILTAADTDEIVKGVDAGGFAMITSGEGTGKVINNQILDPFVAIGDNLVAVTDKKPDATAKEEAQGKRVPVKLERFAAKLIVKKAASISVKDEDQFNLTGWTVDAVNSRYLPFAEKTLMAGHSSTLGSYTSAFYTKDANYKDNAGIVYGTVNATYDQVLPWSGYYGWKTPALASETGISDEAKIAYVIENTMDKASQTIANATRLVLKATYSPKAYTANEDWFSFAGDTYQTLALLQAAYNHEDAPAALKNACDHFYTRIRAYYSAKGILSSLAAAEFKYLTPGELATVTCGGEIVKDGVATQVIFWYKNAICYYYYEIHHDATLGNMAQNKYGVVRNNWYNLTLNSVSGPGTPWYPEIEKPGPGDPGTNDPIDKQAGFLGITINIAPWIMRETEFDI